MNIKEQSLKDVLNFLKLQELPKQHRETDGVHWMEAVTLVRKQDTSLSYAIAKRDALGRISYTHDFGSMSPISGLVSIHPYLFAETYTSNDGITEAEKKERLVEELGEDTREKVMEMEVKDVEEALNIIEIDKMQQRENERKGIVGSMDAEPEADSWGIPSSTSPERTSAAIVEGLKESDIYKKKRTGAKRKSKAKDTVE